MPRFFCVLISIFMLTAGARAENWPHWRGPSGNSASSETGLPTTWDSKTNVLWTADLPGPAGSTPAIWGENIFVSSPDAGGFSLICISTAGKELWRRPVGKGKAKNGASPSPSTDGKHVWVYVGTGDVACFTVEGKPVWKTNLQEKYGKFRMSFGMTTTPLVADGRFYVQLIHSGGAWVIALDAMTGKEVWKHERKSDGIAECEHSYASVQMWRGGGTPYLISHGNDYAIGHDLKDGSEIWRLGDLNPKEKYNRTLRFVSSPTALKELIVVPSAKNGAVVGLSPAAKGKVDRKQATHMKWRAERGTPDVACPVAHDGLIYLAHKSGAITCMDAKTGQVVYRERASKDSFFASPVYADGKVYLVGRKGLVAVVQAGRTFKRLAENEVDDQLDASVAISNGRIYLRGAKKLWAIGSK